MKYYFPFTSLSSPPSLLLSEKDMTWWDGIKEDVWRELMGLTQVDVEGWPFN